MLTNQLDRRTSETLRRTDRSSASATTYSSHTSPTSRYPPTPPKNTQSQFSDHAMQPPLIMQPKHDIQRIDPALFNESKQRHSAHTSPVTTRPTVDTSSYPPYPSNQSTSTPYPHSAPVPNQYAELSPRSAVSAAPGPYYSAPQQQTSHTMSAPSPRRYTPEFPPFARHTPRLPSMSDDMSRRPLLPQQDHRPETTRRDSFHPYNPPAHHRRASHASDLHTGPPHAPASPSDNQTPSGRPVTGRNYICPSCLKEFSRPSSLKIHEHSHTGAKPFVCPRPGCGKSFSVRSNMKRHERGCHLGQPGIGPLTEEDELDFEH